ncbi:MAG TPA: HD domain-containing protein [Candidatus Elarobacter sp.]|nr:HD domain-containing protein [Candidatus Elarobacter sp.]
MPITQIPTLVPGERVQSEFLVTERTEKKTANGDPFAILTLSNATGKIDTAPIWSDKLEWADGADCGRVVQAIGDVALYGRNGSAKRQLALTAPLRILPQDQVDVSAFLESVGDCTQLWDWVDRTREQMTSRTLKSVVDLFFANDDFRLRFEKTPGSTGGHHAKLGGLLLHTTEVATIARTTARTARANLDLVFAGAMLHDIGKVEAYEVSARGFTFTPCGLLIGHVVLGALMLERALAKLGEPVCSEGQLLELQHMILSHHGAYEFGSPVQPMTVEAEIVHWADEASAKASDMMDSISDSANFASDREISDTKPWRVRRHVYRRRHAWE